MLNFMLLADISVPDSSCRENVAFVCIIHILTITSDAANLNVGHLYIWATCHAHSVETIQTYLIKLNQHGRVAAEGLQREGVRFHNSTSF